MGNGLVPGEESATMIQRSEALEERVAGAFRTAERRLTRGSLLDRLGIDYTSWFSDSSAGGDFVYLDWVCGCRAKKSTDLDRLWRYTPCGMHAEPYR
jgi:hypothetical protein